MLSVVLSFINRLRFYVVVSPSDDLDRNRFLADLVGRFERERQVLLDLERRGQSRRQAHDRLVSEDLRALRFGALGQQPSDIGAFLPLDAFQLLKTRLLAIGPLSV